MPLVEVTVGAGRSAEQIRSMIDEVHRAVERTLGARSDHIRIIVREVPRAHWATGNVTLAEWDAGAAIPSGETTSEHASTTTKES